MQHEEFGKLVAALRKEHFDEDGNRLTQAKLAEKAQKLDPRTPLTEIIIGKIERGERAILDDKTLLSLAESLELTLGERREFFLLATGLDPKTTYPSPRPAQEILATAVQMLADVSLPALLVDTYLDVIAVNAPLLQLYRTRYIDLSKRIGQPAGVNLLDFIFSADFHSQRDFMSHEQWHHFVVSNLIYFRRLTLPFRMTPYFAWLLAQLRRHREFRRYWEQVFYEEKRHFVGGESFQMASPEAGRLNYLTTPLVTLTPYGSLELITHIPRNLETAEFFHQLAQQTMQTTYQLSPWPEKNM